MQSEIEILYEDENILAINKPAGLIVHSDGRNIEPSLTDWILKNYPSLRGVGEPWTSPQGEVIPRPGIVHRLDRETSGALLIAKTQEAHAHLKSQFQNREIKKVYHAFTYGHMKEEHGRIEMDIGRTKNIPRKWIAVPVRKRDQMGTLRAAITDWKVLKLGEDTGAKEKVSLVEVMPLTGRTHQIRVHFKAIQHPVVADRLYAPRQPKLLGFERLALHARSIKFKNLDGQEIAVEASYPTDFRHAVDTL